MSTLIVISVVVVYAVASVAYVETSEQRATRHRRRSRGRSRGASRAAPRISVPDPIRERAVAVEQWLLDEPEPRYPEFIRAAPIEFEPTGPWHRVRSSAALLILLTVVGTIVAIVVGVALLLAVLALKNAAG